MTASYRSQKLKAHVLLFPDVPLFFSRYDAKSGAGNKIIPRDVLQFSDTEPRFMAALYSLRRDVRAGIH